MQRALGIDLGTTNSVMAYMFKGEPQIIINRENQDLKPSIVGRGKKGELLVGTPAKSRIVREPQNTIYSIKRFMGRKFKDPEVQRVLGRISYKVTEGVDGDVRVWLGDREYTPIEISALILRRLKEDAEERLNEQFTRAVITVPAYFGERQVAATREAGKIAGFNVLRIINEPTAAALAYRINLQPDEDGKTILVYDLGGGTFDISILMLMQGAITVMGIEGDNLLGGDDFDRSIIEWLMEETRNQYKVDIKDRTALGNIRMQAEDAKIVLSSQLSQDIIVPAVGSEGVDIELELSRQEFEAMIRDRLERTIELTHKAIREANLTPESIDNILLVGGSTAIPMVEQLLKKVFGEQKIRKNVNPMQCVAVGAAIQAGLISDIECTKCHTRNPIQQDQCTKCGTLLGEPAKVNCPICLMPCNIGDATCWKCGNTLSAVSTPPPPPAIKVSPPAVENCPKCGKPYKRGDTTCSICNEVLIDQGGLKCAQCGYPNAQGASVCAKCGHDLPVASPTDMTAKPLGIELHDGRMSGIIPKNTTFPTLQPISRDFKTAVPGQRRLEIAVYEGFKSTARENELCGIVSCTLPPNLPGGTPINVAFGLDDSRTITVLIKVRAPNGGEAVSARLRRGVLDPERRLKVEEHREKLTRFMDRWHDELSEAERRDLQAFVSELEQVLNEDSSNQRQPPEPLFARSDAVLQQIGEIRGTDAAVSNFLFATAKYLKEEDRTKIAQWIADIKQARERADWTAALAISQQVDRDLAQFSDNLHLIARSRIFAMQERLAPALSHKVMSALGHIDDGVDKGDGDKIKQGIEELWNLWPDIRTEIAKSGETPPQITKPVE